MQTNSHLSMLKTLIVSFIIVTIPMSVGAQSSSEAVINAFRGQWEPVRHGWGFEIPQTGTTFELTIESNQIHAQVRLVPSDDDERDAIDIFLVKPVDLGRGGASLPWKVMDRQLPIARLSKSACSKNLIIFKWYGLRTRDMVHVFPFGFGLQGEYLRSGVPLED